MRPNFAIKSNIMKRIDLVLQGRALFTLESQKTKEHFTYKIIKGKKWWFVYSFTGTNNNLKSHYEWIGYYGIDTGFVYRQDCNLIITSDKVVCIMFFFRNSECEFVNFYNEGRCMKCSRKLTTPDSINRHLGPECSKNQQK